MGRPTHELIRALRVTAERLDGGASYQWTHQGRCNCGHLAQTLTRLSHAEIHRMAIEKAGDWGEKAFDYCGSSGYPIDHILGLMMELGMSREDIHHLERLSDPAILERLPEFRHEIHRNERGHVILYMRAMADRLEADWVKSGRPESTVRAFSLASSGPDPEPLAPALAVWPREASGR